MNWTTVQGNWNETKGKVKTKFGRLTDDDLTQAQGQKDRLVGAIQQRYGIAREKAEEQLEEFLSSADDWMHRAKENAGEVVEKGKEYVERGKEYVEKGKEYVQNTSTSQMASDLKDLIVRHPVHSAVIGIGLGFLIGRLLTSSSRS
jgi:uncharacterized protein YjbJ (UPF0337 family)